MIFNRREEPDQEARDRECERADIAGDGGPAFPQHGWSSDPEMVKQAMQGMTLRDWFAGQAFPSVAAGMFADGVGTPSPSVARALARAAFAIADAMLAERNN